MAEIYRARRDAIKLLIGVVAGFGLWKYLSAPPISNGPQLVVELKDLPPEGALIFDDQRVAVIRLGREIFALSLICTHLGCTVRVHGDDFICPCHGSRFDHKGEVLSGPAPRALPRIAHRIEGETLFLQLS